LTKRGRDDELRALDAALACLEHAEVLRQKLIVDFATEAEGLDLLSMIVQERGKGAARRMGAREPQRVRGANRRA
jgi:hypothetical protein